MIEKIKEEVKLLMGSDDNGHGFEHVIRVYEMALKLATKEQAHVGIVSLAALLHDADDYKLFGKESAENLTNARRIMSGYSLSDETVEQVCNIIQTMGYSKALKGVRPQTIEGQVVSDADMLDAVGAVSIVRTLSYTVSSGTKIIFDKEMFPESDLTVEGYTSANRDRDSFVNHFFDKLLKLKNMMFTQAAYEEACVRHKIMVDFLYNYFKEMNCPQWIAYMEEYEAKNEIAPRCYKKAV